MRDSFTVIYRTGGYARFEWRKCLPVPSYEEARKQAAEIERSGYKTLIHNSRYLDMIGLPETWDGATPIATGVL